MKYYDHHIGDFRSGTVHMSRLARWLYRDMMEVYYDTEQPLTLDFELLCDQLGVTEAIEQETVRRILRLKFRETPDGYTQHVCDQRIADYHQKATIARANGSLGGRKSKAVAKRKEPSGLPVAKQQPGGSAANQEPGTNNQEPPNTPRKRGVDTDGFEDFWNAWPKNERKQDRTRCHATWATNGYGAFKDQILADIATKRQTEKWRGGYIEAPLVYLHGERWTDQVTPDGPNGAGANVAEWHESAAGVDGKAQELGLPPCGPYEQRPAFKNRVIAALRELHTEPLQMTLSELMARRPQGVP